MENTFIGQFKLFYTVIFVMDADYSGVIIEESLLDKSLLKKVKIVSTKISPVKDRHKTPWIEKWTMHVVRIPKEKADAIAQELSNSLEELHPWYADFKSSMMHYVIFRGKIFKIKRTNKEQYLEAKKYGVSIGIPDYQVDFSALED